MKGRCVVIGPNWKIRSAVTSLVDVAMRIPVLLLAFLVPFSSCFYIPGLSPVEYGVGDAISVKAVKVWSSDTQLPIDFYDYLSFCDLEGKRVYENLNIGEVLRGDRVVEAPFNINMLTNVRCKQACHTVSTSPKKIDALIHLIDNEYIVNIDVDDLPAAVERSTESQNQYEIGYRIGFKKGNEVYLNNHLKFLVKYHEVNGRYRIVGVTIEPMSIRSEDVIQNKDGTCGIVNGERAPLTLRPGTSTDFSFTYEVEWVSSDTEWASRWDIYLNTSDGQIHWFSIINSIIIIIFLTAVMSVILLKTLRRDIASYNREEDSEEIIEESGWKLVHGDVFRPPRRSALLAAFVGSGVQLLCMTFIVLFFAMLGMLSPASRGALLSAVIFTYVFMGAVAGYFSGRIYKTMRGFYWKSTALLTGLLYPGIILAVCLFINIFLWAKGSSAALPFTTILSILSLWLLVSLPLVFIGFFFGVRKRPYEQPVRTNQIPRAIPDRKMHQNIFITTMLCGLLPFGSVFIELFFIFNALWNRQIYYLFGFLFIVFVILIISCAQVAVVTTYFQLCSEDYRWWWRSFITSGGAAAYLFLYSIYYFATRLEITSFVSTLLYFGYCSILTATFWILTGTIGFFSAFTFLQKIYAAIKID
ncbi:Nonaspanin TM9SF [Echinococcus multilocularis]|uniref:Transmembrane 9 superfamily member n=1 Tax=Echinococcus multilocularis TaxID=6211 RepID=A0A068Y5R1_ECHMU|nr:Nonaspanin TM9SF [Echinococcus multilocularis]